MPARRQSVDPGTGDQRSQPPRSLSGSQSASGEGDKGALDPAARTSRGPPTAATRGSGRGRAKIRGKGRLAASSARRTSAAGSETPHENGAGSDTSSEDPDDGELGGFDSARDSTRPPRPISPELGIPALLAAAQEERPRSSSLSAISSRASSPEDAPAQILIPTLPFFSLVDNESLSPLSDDTARGASRDDDPEPALGLEQNPSTPIQNNLPELDAHDSLSELESSDDDAPLAARAGQSASASGSRSLSTNSTPAPPGTENSGSLSPAPKRRGRPPGSKNRQARQSAPARTQRGGHSTRPGALASPARMSSSESATPAPGSAPARATRANVTLPPGYIWGVTSSRWPRKQQKGEEEAEQNAGDEAESELDELESDNQTEKEQEVTVDGPVEETLPQEPEDVALQPALKVEEQEEPPAVESVDAQAADILQALEAEIPQSEAMSREPSHEGSVESTAVATTPKGKGKGKGKRGKKALPEPVERAKRRKLDGLDKETLEKLAAREAARMKFLSELEAQLLQVEQHSHPLLDYTYARLQEEKEKKLAQLRKYQEHREQELARSLEAARRASWRQWSDGKDRLRTKLYLDNHRSLKSLLDEEKVFPFFRDHPLFVNNHDLPPTGYYRGPQRDPGFTPRALVHAGHYVEPPPVNTALHHDVWSLGADEIEADLALFYDIEDVATPNTTAPPPPSANNSYTFQQPVPPYHIEQAVNGGAISSSGLAPRSAFPRPTFQPYGANVPPPPPAAAAIYAMPAVGAHAYAQHPQMQPRAPPLTTQFVPAPHSASSRPVPALSKATPGPPTGMTAPQPLARPASPPRAVKFESIQPVTASSATTSAPPRSQFAPSIAEIGRRAAPPQSPPRAQQPMSTPDLTSPDQRQPAGRSFGPEGRGVSQYGGPSSLSSFPLSFPNRPGASHPPSSSALSAQAPRSLPSLSAPVWPAYNAEPSLLRPSQQAPPPPHQPFKPSVTASPAPNAPKPGVWAPAPPVMPAPPPSSGVLKSWLPPARPPSHSTAPLPPIRQTLFPTSFPTGGLPPVAKHLSPPPPPPPPPTSLAGTGDRVPAPVRSPQQARPAFPSIQKHDPLPLPSWLRPNGPQDVRSSAIAPGSLPGPKLPHELRAAAEAKPTLKDGPGFPTGGTGFTGGAGAGIRKF